MAVVRITEQIINDVLHKVSDTFNAAQGQAENLRPEIGQEVYDIILAPYKDDMAKVPKEFFDSDNSLDITIRGTPQRLVSETWALDSDKHMPFGLPKPHNDMWSKNHSTYKVTIDRGDKEFADVYARVETWQTALADVKASRAAAQKEVRRVMESFTTLAPALKAWPALWDLLPDYARDKHKQIVERSKPAPVPVVKTDSSHLENLTSKLVMNRISKEPK